MTQFPHLSESWHGDVAVLAIEGEIDASNTPHIAQRMRSAVPNLSAGLVVDLAQTTYLDSAGINLLFELNGDLGQRQQQLRIVVDQRSPIARMISLTGLDQSVPRHDSVADAVAAAGG